LGYELVEKAVSSNEIGNYHAAFLTGTSPKVLPVNAIDDYRFNNDNPLLKNLMHLYNKKIEEYISKRKG